MAIWGSDDSPGELLMLRDGAKLTPLFVLLTNIISLPPAVSSSHATYTLPPETATFGLVETPGLLLRVLALVKVVPASELLANITSEFAASEVVFVLTCSHKAYTLPPETATFGLVESPVALLRFLALVKVAPLSELLANIICPLPVLPVSSHSRYTLLPDTASLGLRESPAV